MSPSITTLESERLYLYPMGLSFCTEIYLSWLNDSDVYKYLESGGGYTMEALVNYVQKSVENKVFFWAICLKENGKHIGNIKIDLISYRHKRGEYGILIGDKSEWKKGFAKEASEVVINFCFDILGLRKITLGVVSSNIAAVSIYKKIGFINEGIYLNHGEYDNKVDDVFRMALFNKNFMNE